MKTVIHVNQHIIKKNRKDGQCRPVLTCKTYRTNEYAHEAVVYFRATPGAERVEVGRFVYRPDRPLSCGAHVWFETTEEVDVVVNEI